MRRLITLTVALAIVLSLLTGAASAADLVCDAERVLYPISPELFGIFLEDINCAVDGGLYAELLKNRSFEWEAILNGQRADHYTAWRLQSGEGSIELAQDNPLHPNNPTCLRLRPNGGSATASNQGFGGNALRGGIALTEGAVYDVSLWLCGPDFTGEVTVQLTDMGGRPLSGALSFTPGAQWTRFQGQLTAEKAGGAVLAVTAAGTGQVDLDLVSLMPRDRVGASWPGGGVRRDLFEALRALEPAFLRFPGGCVVEGSYVRANAYDWKDTVGPLEARRERGNTWGGMQTGGVGFYEYFCLAEELGALPLPVVHAGLLCQAREVRESPLTLEETAAYAQDILDLIEFARGGTDTVWGGLRAEMGHPEPFDLRWVAIGNENWGAAYFSRYQVLSEAVKAVWPDITCIVSAGPVAEGALPRDSWAAIRRSHADSLVDEHYYMDSGWFLEHTDRYDRYPRTVPVFLGEYAAHEPVAGSRRPNNLRAALCEAAYMTGLERNGDLVQLSCYAPLLAREGEIDWTPDLIFFNDTSVLLTPSYYVQQLFSLYHGDQLIESSCEGLYHAVTRTADSLQLKLVNPTEEAVPLSLSLLNVPDGSLSGWQLSGGMKDTNSFAAPDKVKPLPVEAALREGAAKLVLPAASLTVLAIRLTP